MRRPAAILTAASLAFLAAPFGAAFAADHTVTISGFKFQPATLTAAAGDTLTFVNEDSAPHTGTALDGSFDTGRLNKGDSATVSLDTTGEIAFQCNFHTNMKGTVTVE